MKKIFKISILIATVALILGSCTKDFEDINTNPNGADPSTATPDLVMSTVQIYAFGEPRFISWRGNLIYSSRFAHHYIYNFADMAWFPGPAYNNSPGWTDNVWSSSYIKVQGHINALRTIVEGNEADEAVLNIIAGWFYQKMSDMYGDVPYSEVAVPQSEVALKPAYDAQSSIYRSILEDLGTQITVLENASSTSYGDGDFLYGGDPASWATFGNTLRLRLALRSRDAFIADGQQSFIDGVINSALSKPLLDESNQAVFNRAQEGLFLSDPNELMGGLEDVWWSFTYNQSQWTMNSKVVDLMQDNSDPRLTLLCTPADSALPDTVIYAGTEPNLVNPPQWGDLSKPSGLLRGFEKNDPVPYNVILAAESYFLLAEAELLGYDAPGTAEELYQNGILAHMNLYGVDPAAAQDFLDTVAVASLDGTVSENLVKVWDQRWLSLLNNGYEAWALVRRVDMIPDQTGSDYLSNSTSGVVPKRLPYPTSEQTLNAENYEAAVAAQGNNDAMTNPVWWDVD